MRRMRIAIYAAVVSLASLPAVANAQSYEVVVGDIPGTDPLVQLMTAMGAQAQVKVDIQKVPMNRMVHMIIAKQADIGVPMLAIKDPTRIKQLPFDYSTESIQPMPFVLYTNKSRPVDVANLKSGNSKGYKIESDISNSDRFQFATLPSTNVEASFRKVSEGRIDGYLMGSPSTDPILKALKLPNIKRQLYDNYDTVFALQKGARGGPIDEFLSAGLRKLKQSGEFERIMAANLKMSVYDDWQP